MDVSEATRALSDMTEAKSLPQLGRAPVRIRVQVSGEVIEREVADIRFNGAAVVIEAES